MTSSQLARYYNHSEVSAKRIINETYIKISMKNGSKPMTFISQWDK